MTGENANYYEGSSRIASRLVPGNPYMKQANDTTPPEARKQAEARAQADLAYYLRAAGFDSTGLELSGERTQPRADLYYLHSDHLGTATYITDSHGSTTQFFLNLPYGETMAEQNIPGDYVNPYKFNGKELDGETGLYYFGARYYDPRISNWLSVDPLVEKTGEPYIYTGNNPIRFTDPTGMKKEDWFRDNNGIMQYDPLVKSQKDLTDPFFGIKSRGTYVGATYNEKSKRGANVDYRMDGSIMYSNENDAYDRMKEIGVSREAMAVHLKGQTLYLPDYKNDLSTSETESLGYALKGNKIKRSCNRADVYFFCINPYSFFSV